MRKQQAQLRLTMAITTLDYYITWSSLHDAHFLKNSKLNWRNNKMELVLKIILCASLIPFSASAQQTPFQDSLLNHMTGEWILHGTIMNQETTHDVTGEWVLAHQYLQIHEVSREKNSEGGPAYEATVFIGWDKAINQYDCLWLDVTSGGGLNGQGIGHGQRNRNNIAFLFNGSDGSIFHTTFVYDGGKDSWQWIMDGETSGKLEPFARLTLTRK